MNTLKETVIDRIMVRADRNISRELADELVSLEGEDGLQELSDWLDTCEAIDSNFRFVAVVSFGPETLIVPVSDAVAEFPYRD